MKIINIWSRSPEPLCHLSNFAHHVFMLDEVLCQSLEGFLQALTTDRYDEQMEICQLIGYAAKKRAKNWRPKQQLYWQNETYDRHGQDYQRLLDRAYLACARQNPRFVEILLSTGDAILTHDIGKTDPNYTIMTQDEYCDRLMVLRELIKQGDLPTATQILSLQPAPGVI